MADVVVDRSLPAPLMYVLIVVGALTISVTVYELCRRNRVGRFLLGLRSPRRPAADHPPTTSGEIRTSVRNDDAM